MIAAKELHEVLVRQDFVPTGRTVEMVLTFRRDDGGTTERWYPVVAVVVSPGRHTWKRADGPENLVVLP